jgi:hypothetical protein
MALADDLKVIADEAQALKERGNALSIANTLRLEAKTAARRGEHSLRIAIASRAWNSIDVQKAAEELRQENFTVLIDSEIVAWYSNTDYDTEAFIKVSWE